MPRTSSFRVLLAQRDFRLLLGSRAVSTAGDWFYNVALIVYVFDRTHSAGWIAATTIARLLPFVVFGGLAGALADVWDRRMAMIGADAARAVLMLAMALAMHTHAAPAVVLALAFLATTTGSPYAPASSALVPTIVREDALAAANGLIAAVDSAALLAGPALGVLAVSIGSPVDALLVNAGSFLVSGVAVWLVRPQRVAKAPRKRRVQLPRGQALHGFRMILQNGERLSLAAFVCGEGLIYGMELVLLVPASKRFLHAGPEGFGWLLAGMGLGGLVATVWGDRLASARRPTVLLFGAALGIGLPLASLAVIRDLPLAFAVMTLDGASSLVIQVLSTTALQRSIPDDATASVFGALDSLLVAAVLVGSLAAPVLISTLGLRGAVLVAGVVLPLAAVAAMPFIRRAERTGDSRRAALAPIVTVLRSSSVFAGAPQQSLELLASSAAEQHAEPGDVVVAEGAPADDLYVIRSGGVEVVTGDRQVATMGPGDHFGEIGILEGVPRTATVRATESTDLYRIDGQMFLGVINKSPTAASAMREQMGGRLRNLASARGEAPPG